MKKQKTNKKSSPKMNKNILILLVAIAGAIVLGFSARVLQEEALVHAAEMRCHAECDSIYNPEAAEEESIDRSILEMLNQQCKGQCTGFLRSGRCLKFPEPE